MLGRLRTLPRQRLIEHAHESREANNVTGQLRAIKIEIRAVLGSGIELAARGLVPLGVKQLVGDSDFNVVSFARKYFERLVWCLPAKSSDGAVVAAGIGNATDSKVMFLR